MTLEIANEKTKIKQLFIESGYEFKKYKVAEKESSEIKKHFEKCGYSLEADELMEKAMKGLIANITDHLFLKCNDTAIVESFTFFMGQKTDLLEDSIKKIELNMA